MRQISKGLKSNFRCKTRLFKDIKEKKGFLQLVTHTLKMGVFILVCCKRVV